MQVVREIGVTCIECTMLEGEPHIGDLVFLLVMHQLDVDSGVNCFCES